MSILNLSLAATGLIIFIALIRCIFKHYIPKSIFNLLWAIVCCKLILPPSSFRFFEEYLKEMQTKLPGEVMDLIQLPVGIYQSPGTVRQLDVRLLQIIWLAGMVCLASYFIWSYLRCIRMFCMSLPADAIAGAIRQFHGKLAWTLSFFLNRIAPEIIRFHSWNVNMAYLDLPFQAG